MHDTLPDTTAEAVQALTERESFLNLYRVYWHVLSDEEQQALRLVEVEGADYAAVAAALGCDRGAVRALVFGARQKLRAGVQTSLDLVHGD